MRKPRPSSSRRGGRTKPGGGKTTSEYEEYLERHRTIGRDRPLLPPPEFDRLDDEMLDLLAQELDRGKLSDEQVVRLRELEYLLIDTEE